jgi:hypothetical protein
MLSHAEAKDHRHVLRPQEGKVGRYLYILCLIRIIKKVPEGGRTLMSQVDKIRSDAIRQASDGASRALNFVGSLRNLKSVAFPSKVSLFDSLLIARRTLL